MAVDQSSLPRDLRPSNSASRKVKLLCSFGGRILPRPRDGALRYLGGENRIVALHRDASLQDLARKVADAYGGAAVLKYQLPGEELDALVSVSTHEDLENMMEEYDKLAAADLDGSAKLRVFLFSPAEVDGGSDLGLGPNDDDALDGGRRYVEAVNGIADMGVCGIKRKESVASVSSMQTSDGGGELADGAADGMPPAIVPPVDAPAVATTSQESSGSACFGVASDRLFPESTTAALPANEKTYSGFPPHMLDSSQIFQQLNPPAGIAYMPPAYMEPLQGGFNRVDYIQNPDQIQYLDSQQLGLAGVPAGFVAVPRHSYLPAVHIPMAMPMTSQVSREQPIQGRADTRLDDASCGGRISNVAGDPTCKPLQPLSQLPPLPPSSLLAQNVERNSLPQVPPVVATSGQSFGLEECGLCQRALPHAHSDPLIQDHVVSGSTMSVSNKSPAFYSLHSGATSSHALLSAAVMPGIAVERQPYNVVPPHSDGYGYSQISEIQKDVKVAPQKAENLDQTKVLFSPATGFTGATQAPHGLYFGNHSYAWSEDTLQQQGQATFWPPWYLPKHDPVISDSLGINISSARHETHNSQFSVQDSGVEIPCGYTAHAKMELSHVDQPRTSGLTEHQMPAMKPHLVDSAPVVEALYINPSESLVTSEPWKMVTRSDYSASTVVNFENLRIVEENVDNSRSKVGKRDEYLGSTAVVPGIAVGMNSFKPVDLLPSSSLEVTHLHNFQPGDSNQACPSVDNVAPYSHHLELGAVPPIPPERLLQGPSATTKIPTSGDWKDDNSQLYSGSNFTDASPFQLSSVSTCGMHAGGVQGPVPSEPLSCNKEPSQISYLPALKPTLMTGRDKFLPGDSLIDIHLRISDETNVAARLEEGSYHQSLDSLRNDTGPDMTHYMEGSESMKQELRMVADGLVELGVQQPISVPVSYAHEDDFASESNKHRDIGEDNANSQRASQLSDHKAEEVKVGQLDKPNIGVQVVEDIERLQIIKNSDLEELRELGSGTFGTVYHGKWRGSDVAIKRIHNRYFSGKHSEQERWKADFWNEASKLADLHHPNVVAFYGVVLDGPDGSMATVTEYMVNGSLRQALQRNDKTLDHRKRLLIAMDAAFGMEYLHGRNIVHFDLKSDNLLVNLRDPQRPICKVGDLGLSKVKCQTLISGGVRGTLPWMAPELLDGGSNLVSEKVDVFSFGIVMWELLTGEEPYADLHYGAILGGIVSNSLRPSIPESCDPEWRSLMERCWSAKPSERPSFTDIANKLREMAASIPQKPQVQ